MKYIIQKINHFLFADGLRKITALILAFIIYAAIYGAQQKTKTITDVIVNVKAGGNLILDPALEKNPIKANIEVSGDPETLDRISASDFLCTIIVTDGNYSSPGVYKVPVSAANFTPIDNAKNFKVTGCEKSFFYVNAQRIDRKNRDVEIKTVGELSPDFKLGNVTWEPRKLLFDGPEDVIDNLKIVTPEIQLTPEMISTFDKTVDATLNVPAEMVKEVLPDNTTRKFTSAPIKVTVEILAADPVSADIPNLDIQIRKDPANQYVIESNIKKAELTIIGAPSQVEALKKDPSNIEIYADIAEIAAKPGTHSVELHISLPKDGVKVQQITPETVNVTVSEPPKGIFHIK